MEELIRTWLADEESRFIFDKRIEYKKCGDDRVFKEIIDRYVPEFKNFFCYTGKEKEYMDEINGKVWVYGGGIRGKRIINELEEYNIKVEGIIDRDISKVEVMGIPVFTVDKVDFKIIDSLIISMRNKREAEDCFNKVVGLGMDEKNIILHREYDYERLLDKQYFDELVEFHEGEVFVDAGALDLSTSLLFARKCDENHISDYKIYAFEPDKKSYGRCMNIKDKYPNVNIELKNYGLWSSNTSLGFDSLGNGSSHISQKEEINKVNVVTLDSCVKERVTYIKMDIEGAELEALKGCKDTIRQYRPKLAISVYHKKEDIIEIPQYIKELIPEYKLYLRHYGNGALETVLYALP